MSRLRIFDESRPQSPLAVLDDHAAIAAELGGIGVRFEQWAATQPSLLVNSRIATKQGDSLMSNQCRVPSGTPIRSPCSHSTS